MDYLNPSDSPLKSLQHIAQGAYTTKAQEDAHQAYENDFSEINRSTCKIFICTIIALAALTCLTADAMVGGFIAATALIPLALMRKYRIQHLKIDQVLKHEIQRTHDIFANLTTEIQTRQAAKEKALKESFSAETPVSSLDAATTRLKHLLEEYNKNTADESDFLGAFSQIAAIPTPLIYQSQSSAWEKLQASCKRYLTPKEEASTYMEISGTFEILPWRV